MNPIRAVREHLGMTQTEFGDVIGCSQGNVGHYEAGQELPVLRAKTLIAHVAAKRGIALTLDQIYGRAALPKAEPSTSEIR